MKPDSRARIQFCCFFRSSSPSSPFQRVRERAENVAVVVNCIALDSQCAGCVGSRHYLLCVVFMLLHSHSFLIVIRIRLVYQISFAAYHYMLRVVCISVSVSFLHCHSACQISKPDLIVSASDPAIWFRISPTN